MPSTSSGFFFILVMLVMQVWKCLGGIKHVRREFECHVSTLQLGTSPFGLGAVIILTLQWLQDARDPKLQGLE